jgi:heme oxygenase
MNALARMYGFVAPAERMIWPHVESTLVPLGYRPSPRVVHLEKDLSFMGFSPDQIQLIPLCESIPRLDSVAAAMGCLYLFEGSRVGGRVLIKPIIETFGFKDGLGYAYFGSDGMDVPALWDDFKMFMEDFAASERMAEEIIGSAVACFSALNTWLGEE